MDPGKCLADVISDPLALTEFLKSNSQLQNNYPSMGGVSPQSFSQQFQLQSPQSQHQLLQQISQQQQHFHQQMQPQQQQQQQLHHTTPVQMTQEATELNTYSEPSLAAELNSSLDFLASIAAAASEETPKDSPISTSNRTLSQFDSKHQEFMYSSASATKQTLGSKSTFLPQSTQNIRSPVSGQGQIKNLMNSNYPTLTSPVASPGQPRMSGPPKLQPVGTLAAQTLGRTSGPISTQASSSAMNITDSPPPPNQQMAFQVQKQEQKPSQKQTQKHLPNILLKSSNTSTQPASSNQTILLPANVNVNGKLLIVNSPGKGRQTISLAPAQQPQAGSTGQQVFIQQKGQQLFVLPQTMQQKILTQTPAKSSSNQVSQQYQQQPLVSQSQPTTTNFGPQQASKPQTIHSPSPNLQSASQNISGQRQPSPMQTTQQFEHNIQPQPQTSISSGISQDRNLQLPTAMRPISSPNVLQRRNIQPGVVPLRPQISSNVNVNQNRPIQAASPANTLNVRMSSTTQQRDILPKVTLPQGNQTNILPKTSIPQNLVVVGKPNTKSGQTQRLSHFPIPVQKLTQQQMQSLQRSTMQQRSTNQASSPIVGQTPGPVAKSIPSQKSDLSLAQQQASHILQQIAAVAGKVTTTSATPGSITSSPVLTQAQTTSTKDTAVSSVNSNPQVQVNLLNKVALQQLLQLKQFMGPGGQAALTAGGLIQKATVTGQQQAGQQKLHHLDLPRQQQQQQLSVQVTPQLSTTVSKPLQPNASKPLQVQQFPSPQGKKTLTGNETSHAPKTAPPSTSSILDANLINLLNQQSSEANRQMQQLLVGQHSVQTQAQSSPNININLGQLTQRIQSETSQNPPNKDAIAQHLFNARQITQAQLTDLQKKLVMGKILQQLQTVQPKPSESLGSAVVSNDTTLLEDNKPSTNTSIRIQPAIQPTSKTLVAPKIPEVVRKPTAIKNLTSTLKKVPGKTTNPAPSSSKINVPLPPVSGIQRKINPPILQPAISRKIPVVTLSNRITPSSTLKMENKTIVSTATHSSRKTPISVVPSIPKVIVKPQNAILQSKPLSIEQQKVLQTKKLQQQLQQLTQAQREQLLRHQQQLARKGQPVPLSKLLLQLKQNDPKTSKPTTPTTTTTNQAATKRPLKEEEKKVEVHVESPIAKRLKHCLQADQTRVVQPDYKKPFRSIEDALSRLLPYHIYNESLPQFKDWQKGETIFNIVAKQLITRKEKLLDKYHLLMLEESQRDIASSEMVMLERIFLTDEKAKLAQDKEDAKSGKFKIPKPEEEITEEKLLCVEEMDVEDETCESTFEDNESSADSGSADSDEQNFAYERNMSAELTEATSNLLADLADGDRKDSSYELDDLDNS